MGKKKKINILRIWSTVTVLFYRQLVFNFQTVNYLHYSGRMYCLTVQYITQYCKLDHGSTQITRGKVPSICFNLKELFGPEAKKKTTTESLHLLQIS